MPRFTERISAYAREHTGGVAQNLDRYLSEHLPELMDTHRLATRNDFIELESGFARADTEVGDLEVWRDTTEERLRKARIRMERLELKYGVEVK